MKTWLKENCHIYIDLNSVNAVLLKKNIDFEYKIIDFMILFTK